MKIKFLSLILTSILSVSLLVGCGNDKKVEDNNQPSIEQEENTTDSNNDEKSEDEQTSNDKDASTQEENFNLEENIDEKVEEKFTDAINFLYNRDYSNQEEAQKAENYANENFTPEGAKDMINKIISYNSEVTSSDLVITLVKEIKNNDERYSSMYEVRYNINVAIGKPSVYSDIIATLVTDKDGNIFIEKINDFNF